MKKLAVIILLLSFIGTGRCLAQTPVVSKGSPYKMSVKKGGWSDLEPIGHDTNGTYYLLYPFSKVYDGAYIGNKDTYIGKVNNAMELEKFETLKLTYEDKELQLEFAFQLNDNIYLFSSFQNNLLKKTFLFAQTLNTHTLHPNADLKQIAEIDYSEFGKYKNSAFSYRLSKNQSKILFIHNLLDKDDMLLSFGCTVTDSQLKPIRKTSGLTLFTDGIYNFQDFYISDNAEVYALTRYFEDKKELKNNVNLRKQGFLSSTRSREIEANFEYKILKFGESTKSHTLKINNAFITSASLVPEADGRLICMGFYSDNDDAIPDGTFFQEIDKGMTKAIREDKKSLEGKFAQPSKYSNGTYEGYGLLNKSDDLDDFRFVLKDIIVKKNGGYVLTAERNATLQKTQNDGKTITVYNVYHTDDIVVINVSAEGKIDWIRKIEKAQETSSLATLYASYECKEVDDELVFFFTDIANQNFKFFGKVVDTKAYMVKLDQRGNETRHEIFNADEDAITLKAMSTYTPSDKEHILYGHNGLMIVGFCKVSTKI